MAQKCVHKGCGKVFTDHDEDCIYHPGGPVFHEGQKGWKCCKPRVLTFEEFLAIPPCTTGKHSVEDDAPTFEGPKSTADPTPPVPDPKAALGIENTSSSRSKALAPQAAEIPAQISAPPAESESDDPSISIPPDATCRRRGCGRGFQSKPSIDDQECVYHSGHPIFHEGSKGWTCCKRRVLEFDEFMRIGGCKKKNKHLFVGSGKQRIKEEFLSDVRYDFYQTQSTVTASFYLKKIDKEAAKITFDSSLSVDLDLPTADQKRYKTIIPLFDQIDTANSTYKIMGTKLELTLLKMNFVGWPTLRSDEKRTSEIIQVGPAGRR